MTRLTLNIHGTVRVEIKERSCTQDNGKLLVWTDLICYDRDGDAAVRQSARDFGSRRRAADDRYVVSSRFVCHGANSRR